MFGPPKSDQYIWTELGRTIIRIILDGTLYLLLDAGHL